MRALARLCPMRGKHEAPLPTVCAYNHLLTGLQTFSSTLFHSLVGWLTRERRRCSYFVAVTLDRRITQTRKLWAEQMIPLNPKGRTLRCDL